MSTATQPGRYVVTTGAVGPRPMWWEVCPPTSRDHALDVMHHLTELTPAAFAPDGHRRLRVVAAHTDGGTR